MRRLTPLLLMLLTACGTAPALLVPAPDGVPLPTPQEAARNFAQVVAAVEPVAERECLRRGRVANCDFLIAVDPDLRAQANAYQSLDPSGRPVVTFTIALIASAANSDELAFVMGHEAAHHIAGHLAQQRANAELGAEVFAGLASRTGGNPNDVARAQQLGAMVGARSYSKEFELEADQLGTIITHRAGYDPLAGARFFTRIPDPGDRFLGSHPPNAARLQVVRDTARGLGIVVE